MFYSLANKIISIMIVSEYDHSSSQIHSIDRFRKLRSQYTRSRGIFEAKGVLNSEID